MTTKNDLNTIVFSELKDKMIKDVNKMLPKLWIEKVDQWFRYMMIVNLDKREIKSYDELKEDIYNKLLQNVIEVKTKNPSLVLWYTDYDTITLSRCHLKIQLTVK